MSELTPAMVKCKCRKADSSCLQPYFMAIVFALIWTGSAAEGAIAYVSHTNGSTLLNALENQAITTIILTGDYDVGNEFNDYSTAKPPVQVQRNVTITGQSGSKPLWNLRFQRAAVEICANCTFTILDIGIAQERRGNGASIDFFVGQPGSVLVTDNMLRVRPACTSTASTIDLVLKDQKRSPRFLLPGPEQKQIIGVADMTYKGVTYKGMLLLTDFAYDVPLSYQEALGNVGGYTLRVINTTRLCEHILSGDCLAIKSPDACVNDMIDELLAQSTRQDSTKHQIAVAVPVAVVGGAAILAAAVLLHRRRKRRAAQPEKSVHSKLLAVDVETGKGGSGGPVDVAPPVIEPLVDTAGWKIVSMNTTPSIGQLNDVRIQLGGMLGAGSYGRVYKGRWAGRDVAVKVIEHESAAAVENEVQLMLSINHPNVVRAYHYVTYSRTATSVGDDNDGANQATTSSGTANQRARTAEWQLQQQLHMPRASLGVNSQSSSVTSGTTSAATHVAPASAPSGATPSELVDGDGSMNDSSHAFLSSNNSKAAYKTLLAQQQQQHEQQHQQQQQQPQQQQQQQQHQQADDTNIMPVAGSDHTLTGDQEAQLQQHMHMQQQLQLQPHALQMPSRQQADNTYSSSSSTVATPTVVTSALAGAAAGPPTPVSAEHVSSGVPCDRDSWAPQAGSGHHITWPGCTEIPCSTAADNSKEVERSRTWLVQEYCDCGTLSSWVSKVLQAPTGNDQLLQLLMLLQDAARGVQHLHAKSIVHGDLNARNVLVSSTMSGGVTAKLADLGISRVIKQHSTHRTTNTVGTMSHMPPELLRYGRMSPAVDVYAFGVMMWELYSAQIAFKRLQYGQFFEHVVLRNNRPPIPPDMPDDYSLLASSCWVAEPSERPSVGAVLDCLGLMIHERQQQLQEQLKQRASSVSSHSNGISPKVCQMGVSRVVQQCTSG